ncbi:hypothetical protein [Salsipaludibacter albus]|uniref:hypothetical protein n=1 Tax=Salsipaludibacter albus TaxID=2849650 RepID=UPI001EE4721D|nr:hypothetical protein [Salsipaludibacter albus]
MPLQVRLGHAGAVRTGEQLDRLHAKCTPQDLEDWLDEAERLVDLLERSRADAEVVLTAYLDTAMRWQGPIRLANLDLAVRHAPGVGPRVEQLQHRWRRLVSHDDVAASATLGVLTRPIVQLGDGRVVQERSALVEAATMVLAALDPGHATD